MLLPANKNNFRPHSLDSADTDYRDYYKHLSIEDTVSFSSTNKMWNEQFRRFLGIDFLAKIFVNQPRNLPSFFFHPLLEKNDESSKERSEAFLDRFRMPPFTPDKIAKQEKAASGNVSTVTKITLKNGDVYYSKKVGPAKDAVTAALVSGIPSEENRFAERSIFAFVMSCELGLDLVPETCLSIDQNGDKIYVQKEVKGVAGWEYFAEKKSKNKLESAKLDEGFIKQLIEAQLFDGLLGQVDRNGTNYRYDETTDKLGLIDNDVNGGFLVVDPDSLLPTFRDDGYGSHLPRNRDSMSVLTNDEIKLVAHLNDEGYTEPVTVMRRVPVIGRSVFLPPVIDTDMVRRYRNLEEGRFLELMSLCGFNYVEMEAARSRLNKIKSHIDMLELRQQHGKLSIIHPNRWWNPETHGRLMPQPGKIGNALCAFASYFQRDYVIEEGTFKPYDEPQWVKERDQLK